MFNGQLVVIGNGTVFHTDVSFDDVILSPTCRDSLMLTFLRTFESFSYTLQFTQSADILFLRRNKMADWYTRLTYTLPIVAHLAFLYTFNDDTVHVS